jgi:hypothetical protein
MDGSGALGQPNRESFFGTPLATFSARHWMLDGKGNAVGIGCAGRKTYQNLPPSRQFFPLPPLA